MTEMNFIERITSEEKCYMRGLYNIPRTAAISNVL